VSRINQIDGRNLFSKVDPIAPGSGDVAAVVGAHPPVERFVGKLIGVVGGQGNVIRLVAPVGMNRVALRADLYLVVGGAICRLPGKGWGYDR